MVTVRNATWLPGIERCAGGVCLVQQGSASDEPQAEMEPILAEVEGMLNEPRAQVLVATGARSVSELFAPANPEVRLIPGMLVWMLDVDSLAGARDAPALVQRVLRALHRLGTLPEPMSQMVYLRQIASHRARALAELILGLAIEVRVLQPGRSAMVLEVHRPEGVVLSALLGQPQHPTGAPDTYARAVNAEKDAASSAGARGRLQNIERQERAELARRLTPPDGTSSPVAIKRAPRLGRLLLAAADGGEEAARALREELAVRELPLLVMVDPETRGASLRSWRGGLEALPVYPDEATLLASARDLNKAPGSFAMALMPPRKLFGWAASQGWAVAIGLYREPAKPIYVPLRPDVVRALADGKA